MQFKVRSGTLDDKRFIYEMHRDNKEHIGAFNYYRSFYGCFESSRCYYLIIDNVGFARYTYQVKIASFVLMDIAVKPEFRGTGAAETLLNACQYPLRLKVHDDNFRAIAFYLKNGFRAIGITRTKKGVGMLIMSKNG